MACTFNEGLFLESIMLKQSSHYSAAVENTLVGEVDEHLPSGGC